MRIVQFNKNAVPAEYPANFRKTALVGDVYVGEYSGSDVGIADYLGAYPIPDYQSSMSKTEWRSILTGTEVLKLDKVRGNIEGSIDGLLSVLADDPHPVFFPFTYRDALRSGFNAFDDSSGVDVAHPDTATMVNTMSISGILDGPEREAEILLGKLQ